MIFSLSCFIFRPTSPMPSNYYVSPPKAMIELEIRKLSDSNQLTQDISDNDTLAQKKVTVALLLYTVALV